MSGQEIKNIPRLSGKWEVTRAINSRKFFAGQWFSLGIAHYARKLNRTCKRRNRTFLRVVDLLRPGPGAKISVDYREEVRLDR